MRFAPTSKMIINTDHKIKVIIELGFLGPVDTTKPVRVIARQTSLPERMDVPTINTAIANAAHATRFLNCDPITLTPTEFYSQRTELNVFSTYRRLRLCAHLKRTNRMKMFINCSVRRVITYSWI